MTVAVLAVQGAFIEHEKMLQNMGIDTVELRQKEDLNQHFDGIVLPGGESTVQGKLLKELGMFDSLKQRIQSGMPVLATCAGLILLAEELSNDEKRYFQSDTRISWRWHFIRNYPAMTGFIGNLSE